MKFFSSLKQLLGTKWMFFISFLMIISACNPSDQSIFLAKKEYREPILKGRDILRQYMLNSFAPGVSVSVSYNNEIIWSEGIGLASKELKVPATRQTKYRIGNTAQIFTASVVAMLQQQGKMNVDSSFYAYIPHFPKKEFDYTLRMLGSHTAGFQGTRIENLATLENLTTLRDYVTIFDEAPLIYQPDTYFLFSDYGTALLGIATEQVTGKRYFDLLKELILDTLELKNTIIDYPEMIVDNRSNFYSLDYLARLINAPKVDLSAITPVHGLLSTADDLNTFARQMLKPGLFTQNTLDLFSTNRVLPEGFDLGQSFGWMVFTDKQGRNIIGQIGNTVGGSSAVMVCPSHNLVVTACSNKNEENTEIPAYAIAQVFLDHLKVILDEIAEEETDAAAEQAEMNELFGSDSDEGESE